MLFVFFPCLFFFNILSMLLIFIRLITMCLDVFLLEFFLPGPLCTSWTLLTISFLILWKLLDITSSNIFLIPFSLSSFWDHMIWMLVHLMFSQRSLMLSSFLFFFFFFFPYIIFCNSDFSLLCLPGHLFIFSAFLILLLIPYCVFLFICSLVLLDHW